MIPSYINTVQSSFSRNTTLAQCSFLWYSSYSSSSNCLNNILCSFFNPRDNIPPHITFIVMFLKSLLIKRGSLLFLVFCDTDIFKWSYGFVELFLMITFRVCLLCKNNISRWCCVLSVLSHEGHMVSICPNIGVHICQVRHSPESTSLPHCN